MKANTRRIGLSSIAVAVALFATPFAASAAETGGYLGLAGGSGKFKDFNNKTRTAYRVYGGYDFSRYFGAELGYIDFGRVDNGPDNARLNGVDVSALGKLPVTNRFDVFGRAGVVRSRSKSNIAGVSATDTRNGAVYGAGVQYNFTDNFGLRGEWDRYRHTNANADFVSANLVFHFMPAY